MILEFPTYPLPQRSHSLPLVTKIHIKSLSPPFCSRRVAVKTSWSSKLSTLEYLAPRESEILRKSRNMANTSPNLSFPQSLRFLYFARLVFTASQCNFRKLGRVDWFRFARRGHDFGFAWFQLRQGVRVSLDQKFEKMWNCKKKCSEGVAKCLVC